MEQGVTGIPVVAGRFRAIRVALAAGLASGAAVGLGAALLSSTAPMVAAPAHPVGKLVERLPGAGDGTVGRPHLIYDTVALFAPPRSPAETPVAAQAPARRAVEDSSRRVVAVLPPSRPASVVVVAERPQVAPALSPVPGQPIRLLGFALPGSEHLPSGPAALAAMSQVGSQVGGRVASLTQAVADTVLMR